jgi:hypothetical protein
MAAVKRKRKLPDAPRAAPRGRHGAATRAIQKSDTPQLQPASQSDRAQLIRRFMGSLPIDQWDQILATHEPTSKGGKLMALMHDPSFATWSLERLCAEAGVDFKDLVRMVSDHSLGKALIGSTPHIAAVIDGMAQDATSRLYVCDMCLDVRDESTGETYLVVPHPHNVGESLRVQCPKCGGMGRVRRGGDARKAETFLKLHGALEEPAAGGVVLNQQFNFGAQHAHQVQRGQQLLAEGRSLLGGGAVRATNSAPALKTVDLAPRSGEKAEKQ